MLSFKTISHFLSFLLILEGGLLLLCIVVAAIYKEDCIGAFAIPAAIALFLGITGNVYGKDARQKPYRKESYFIVAIVWVVFSLIGMLPFLFTGSCNSVFTAFFEAMSGFTTTGATALPNLDALPRSILFWRSLTQWIGGLGIVFFTITLLPTNIQGGSQLFSAEATGIGREKIHAHIGTTARWLWSLYAFLTLGCAACLYGCGMGIFDSLNYAMSAMATGGFAPHSQGLLYYDSPAIETVIMVFMFISAINFTLLYLSIFKNKWKALFQSEEIHFLVLLILIVGAITTLSLIFYNGYAPLHALRVAFFNIISLQTTTGFATDNFCIWYQPLWLLILASSLIGACSGSTCGGLKCKRVLILVKNAVYQFKRQLHPNAVIPVCINGKPVFERTDHVLLSFFFWYIGLIFFGTVAYSFMDLSLKDSAGLAIACVSNIGPFAGHAFGPLDSLASLPACAKLISTFLMLAGRLEIFSVLIPFTFEFWKRD